jgi:hypothetical protein
MRIKGHVAAINVIELQLFYSATNVSVGCTSFPTMIDKHFVPYSYLKPNNREILLN